MPQNSVIYLGLFVFFLALALFVPQLESMLLDISQASSNVKTLFKLAFTIIGFGFLLAGAMGNGE